MIIKNHEMLIKLARLAHDSNQTIVTTNGCFDILHSGHVQLLKKAATFGDVLIVLVNSDLSVRQIKGEGRPRIALKHRLRLLNELGIADIITSFEETTPCTILERIGPDLHVKGGDYKLEDMPETDVVESIICIPHRDHVSTTELLEEPPASGSPS